MKSRIGQVKLELIQNKNCNTPMISLENRNTYVVEDMYVRNVSL